VQMGQCVKMVLVVIRCDNVDGIHMTQDRDQYQALVNTLIKIQITSTAVNLVNATK
jgi:hypothetical protein